MEDFFTYINDWLDSGVYGFFTEATAYLIEYMVLSYLQFINLVIPFAWGVAKVILEDLNVSSLINQAYGQFPSMSRDIMTALRVPECINFALSSVVTKFVLRFIPGL